MFESGIPLEHCHSPPGPHPNNRFVSIRGDPKSIITRTFPTPPPPTPLPCRHHRRRLRVTPPVPPHVHPSRHPLCPWPLQPAHRLLHPVRSTHSHLIPSVNSLPGSNAMFPCSQARDHASYFDVGPTESHWPEDQPKIVQ